MLTEHCYLLFYIFWIEEEIRRNEVMRKESVIRDPFQYRNSFLHTKNCDNDSMLGQPVLRWQITINPLKYDFEIIPCDKYVEKISYTKSRTQIMSTRTLKLSWWFLRTKANIWLEPMTTQNSKNRNACGAMELFMHIFLTFSLKVYDDIVEKMWKWWISMHILCQAKWKKYDKETGIEHIVRLITSTVCHCLEFQLMMSISWN